MALREAGVPSDDQRIDLSCSINDSLRDLTPIATPKESRYRIPARVSTVIWPLDVMVI